MFDLEGYGFSLLLGTWETIKITMVSMAIGLCLGLVGAVSKLSPIGVLRWAADGITTIIRGLPELLIILSINLTGSLAVNQAARWIGYEEYVEISSFTTGVFSLGIIFGAYATEIFRGAILAVHKGQVEAAKACAMSAWVIFKRIILPHVWRISLPGLGNLFLILQKNTAILSVIGLHELMRYTSNAVVFTKKPFTFFFAASLIYLLLTIISMLGFTFLERRSGRGFKRGI